MTATAIRTIHTFVAIVATLAAIACAFVGDWMPAAMFGVLAVYATFRLRGTQ